MNQQIPIHDFSTDDSSSIPFKLIPLERKSSYDTSRPHRHNYYEIFCFEQGGGNHKIDFETYEIQSQSIHFVSPGQVHHVKRSLDSFGFVILFSREFYYLNLKNKDVLFELPFLNNGPLKPVLNLETADFTLFKEMVLNIQKESTSLETFKEEVLRSYLTIFLIQCKRLLQSSQKESTVKDNALVTIFSKFRVLLENNFVKLHKPIEYADSLSITEKYLNQAIKEVTGKTVGELIQERLILETKRLLLHSELSTKEIAHFLNFDDPSYFTRVFKKNTGLAPTDFRKEIRKKYL